MKDKLEAEIEIHRSKNISLAGHVILNRIVGFVARKKFVQTKYAIIVIQKIYRVNICSSFFASIIICF